MGFRGENFYGLLAYTANCPLTLQTITEKTFADKYKTTKVSLSKVSHCTVAGNSSEVFNLAI